MRDLCSHRLSLSTPLPLSFEWQRLILIQEQKSTRFPPAPLPSTVAPGDLRDPSFQSRQVSTRLTRLWASGFELGTSPSLIVQEVGLDTTVLGSESDEPLTGAVRRVVGGIEWRLLGRANARRRDR